MPRLPVALVGLAVVGLAGCGRQPSPPAFVPIVGVVTYSGRPLAGALVAFYPQDSPGQMGAEGTTDLQGRYEVKTGGRPGLRAGVYQINVTTGVRPSEAKVGDSFQLYGNLWRKIQPTDTRVDLALEPAETGGSY